MAINEEALEILLRGSLGVVREGDDGADAEVEAGASEPVLLVEMSGTGPMHTDKFCNAVPSMERVRERMKGVPALISSISLACFLASIMNKPLPRTPCC